MNYSAAIFLINAQARCLLGTYDVEDVAKTGKIKREAFKTLDPTIHRGDLVIVTTTSRHGFTVVKIVEEDVEPNFDATEDFRWVVGKVDNETHERLKAQEAEAIEAIKKAERMKKRRELAETMLADAGDAVRSLPIYVGPEEQATIAAPDRPAPKVDDLPI